MGFLRGRAKGAFWVRELQGVHYCKSGKHIGCDGERYGWEIEFTCLLWIFGAYAKEQTWLNVNKKRIYWEDEWLTE